MFIYNVTVKVNWSIHDDWLQWVKDVHMPEVVGTGCFTGSRLVRILDTDEEEGPTYAAQYYAKSMDDYNRYIDSYADGIRQKSKDLWGDQFIIFRTLMEIVH